MIFKNIKHNLKLCINNFILATKYDVLIEKAVTIKHIKTIFFDKGTFVQSGSYIYGSKQGHNLIFLENSVIGPSVSIFGEAGVYIGKNVHIVSNCILTTQYGDYNLNHDIVFKYASIKIGDNSVIGANSIIMPGATIGKNCIVYAGSIVFGNIKDNSKIRGNPARAVQGNL